MLPTVEKPVSPRATLHPAFFVASWIVLSSVTILFNKYLLDNLDFHFPAVLTCWHMIFSTIATQILARTTSLLDGRKTVRMTGRLYLRAIVPIGLLYSASLVCSNQVYLYLSVAFTQMLKASAPAAVLVLSWLFRVASPNRKVLFNVLIIVAGVALASFGEIKFVWLGFIFQLGGIFSEAVRLIMIQILLSGEGQNMDPLVSLYYYAPVCAVMNLIVAGASEATSFHLSYVWSAGVGVLLLNAGVAFMLNVASVFLIGKTSGLVMTLCGVLKNILLVGTSVLIWGTVITPLQIIGYTIASLGLVYYGVGYEGIQAYYSNTQQFAGKVWQVTKQPGRQQKKALIATALVIFVFLLVGGMVKTGQTPQFIKDVLKGGATVDQ